MIRFILFLMVTVLASKAAAEVVVPTRTIRANSIIVELDVGISPANLPNAYDRVVDVIGQEARTTLYAGRPILLDQIGPPAIVARNQIVELRFVSSGLTISTEGRSLERGGVGDRVRIMNLSSRTTLFGLVQPDGTVKVHN